jgi:Na+/H+ antiporter NhaD/arsenite permease-like protein
VVSLAGVPIEFALFGATLLAVAAFHRHALAAALVGLTAIIAWKFAVTGFPNGPGLNGFVRHLAHEWVILANLLALLVSFAVLARHVEQSGVPDRLPEMLPSGWGGAFALLVIVFALSAILDNIAAALIGGTVARAVFKGRVHTGYVAGIVAASNAGGSGSVLGDTTTTMMWIAGVDPLSVLDAYIAAVPALIVFGIPAARQQHRLAPLSQVSVVDRDGSQVIDWGRLAVVGAILVTAVIANVSATLFAPKLLDQFPVLGGAVAAAVLLTGLVRKPDWTVVPGALLGALFLLALVLAASLMPVDQLPKPSLISTFGLGVISAVFDNIPLTALALKQGGYDWGMLAYAVGFGGSMIWFGSSAGVAITGVFPEARTVWGWLRAAWHVPLGYAVGYGVLALTLGWHPQ